ncbi:P-loop containing nucleoside triphosphate hydrolase protein [Dioscorea alata]|uniref:P-loop containing nucleoside triphosphate hydrolase protein n=2 Tax=Dioscorea alata TaxID=55571 RepID=A0ACB7UQC4_DIOAL|nr:P-loop containing nucleoside triphosphate hydrolase protein [Dioscorea alata]KAH7662862.1 P-loop containing nucleoside triphosphate hydrolase protein [Dioscorea alata]
MKVKAEMEEIQPYLEHYRSSSSSASSPAGRATTSNFFYLRKPGCSKNPISFEDSPEWDEPEVFTQLEEGGDSIRIATTTASPSLSRINSRSFPSPSFLEASASARKIAGATIVWKDLSVTVKDKSSNSHTIVKSASGYALPGSLTVIMGPARAGKTTLLRALAGRLRGSERILGEFSVNGLKSHLPYGTYGYVGRDEMLIESLTVREMLSYSALLQLPGVFSEKKSMVDDAIAAMSLGDYADKLIGGHCYMERLPGGERRRVSIARELVMRPHALFIDEPLYHLDSVSALLLMVSLKKLANTGCTLIFTMYQSSTEVFGLFDRICLLSNGNVLFFGQTLGCLQHFANAGFPCPIMQSPSDHFLRAINTEFDRIIAMCKNLKDEHDFSSVNMDTAVAIRTLEAMYKESSDAAFVDSLIESLNEKEGPEIKSKGQASNTTRIAVLTWRSLVVMSRDWKYFWIRLFLSTLLALFIGTIFCNIGHSLSSVMVRVAAIFAFVSFTLLLSVISLPAHIREIKVFKHEESNRHSSAGVFLLGHLLASIPFLFLITISSALVFYFLVGLQSEFSLLMYFVLNMFTALLANEGLLMLVACIWLESFAAIIATVFIHVIMMLVGGYFRLRDGLPEPIWYYPFSYISFHTYAVQGLLENEYVGTSFAVGQVRAISGVQAVRGSYGISASRDAKWFNLLILCLMAVGYRMVLFCLLHLNARKLMNGLLAKVGMK